MDDEKVRELKQFVNRCSADPSLLHDPSLSFFKEYLHSLGATIPPKPNVKVEGDNDQIYESELEFEGEVVEPDNDPPQKMGDPSIEVSEENQDAAQSYKGKAMEAISNGSFDEAIEHLTEAILLNPSSSLLYATRASVFVKMKKPNAAIKDADVAIEMNPDSAKAYKARGMAKALLGLWEEAVSDLRLASKLDYDEATYSVLKKVESNIHKIEEHRRKYERLRNERELRKAEREEQFKHAEAEDKRSVYVAALRDGQVINIQTSSELDSKLNAASKLSRLCILYFTATWCGPCRFMAPAFANLAEKHPNIVFLKVDIDELSTVAHRWNVSSVPTFFFVKNEKEVDKVVGADKSGLEGKIALHSSKS